MALTLPYLCHFGSKLMHTRFLLDDIILLRPNYTSWTADSYIAQGSPGRELEVLHEVAADQHSSPPQTSFAMDGKCA